MKQQITREAPQTLLDEHGAASHISMSVAYLRADRVRGHPGNRTPGPPYIKLGRAIRYDVRDLDAWIDAHRVDRARELRAKQGRAERATAI